MGEAFQLYLNALRERRQYEMQQEAMKQQYTAMALQSVANVGGEIANKIVNDRKLRGQYQTAWKMAGSPMIDTAKTPTDERIDSIKAKIQALKTNVDSAYTSATAPSEKPAKFSEIDKRISTYTKELEDLNRQMAELETFRTSPEYAIEKENAGFKKFLGVAPIDSGKYYEIMGGLAQPKTQDLKTYEEKKKIDLKYREPKGGQSSKDILSNIKTLRSQFDELDKDLMMDEAEKFNAKKNIYDNMLRLSKMGGIDQTDIPVLNALLPTEPKMPEEPKIEKKLSRKERKEQERLAREKEKQDYLKSLER